MAFVLIGRASHREHLDLAGDAVTAWPFLVGLAAGWSIARAWRRPLAVRAGLLIWPVVVVLGMLLRALAAQGVQVGFVVVATIVLGLFLVGWRAIAALVLRRRQVRQ